MLLEEPETFLSSHATVALVDVVAQTVDSRRLYAVLTTHSAGIVARAPLEVLRVLMPSGAGVEIRAPESQAELEHLLGSFVGQARLAFVEDRTAAVVVAELLGRFAGLWGQAVDVVPVHNGAAEVVAGPDTRQAPSRCEWSGSSTEIRVFPRTVSGRSQRFRRRRTLMRCCGHRGFYRRGGFLAGRRP